jgi:Tfp pilus assembly protein PilO
VKPSRSSRPAWLYLLFAALALLLVNAVAFAAFTFPRLERSRRAAALEAELRTRLDKERADYERLRRRAEVLSANQRDAKRFFAETAVPLRSGLAIDLDAIEDALRRSGLQTGQRQYNEGVQDEFGLIRFGIQMSLSGSLSQAARFLNAIESSPRFLVVDRVTLREEGERGTGRVKMDVLLSTFYRGEGLASARAARRSTARR